MYKRQQQQRRVLNVKMAVEPDCVRWQDLNASVTEQLDQQILTGIVTFACIIFVGFLVTIADTFAPFGAAFSIAGKNILASGGHRQRY